MEKVLKLFFVLLLVIYLAVLTYVPLLLLADSLNFILVLWSVLWLSALALLFVIYRQFSRIKAISFIAIFIVLHLFLFLHPVFINALEMDNCLDSGGAWKDGECVFNKGK